MPESILEAYHIEHPAPHGGRVRMGLVWTGLLAPPIAWSIQLLVNYGLASYACFPRDFLHASAVPGWEWVSVALFVLNLAALVIAFIGAFLSYRTWRTTTEEASGGHQRLLQAGEGRTRFLAAWGVWAGIWFAIAIIFDTIAVFWVPLCGG